jgi:hypothetical protein
MPKTHEDEVAEQEAIAADLAAQKDIVKAQDASPEKELTVAVKAAEGFKAPSVSVAIGAPVTLGPQPVDLPAAQAKLVLESPAAVRA